MDTKDLTRAKRHFQKDTKVRDGCTLYCDIYRPVSSDKSDVKVPAIVAWSPFGKKHTGIDMMSKVCVSHEK